jgi:DNA-binding NtrC family response regulator
MKRLQELDWPGNVRELRNTVERLLILAAGPRITVADVDRLVGRRPAARGAGSARSPTPAPSRSSSTPPSARSCSPSCASTTGT